MTKKRAIKDIKEPKEPRNIKVGEMEYVQGLKTQGFTQKEMSDKLIKYRKDTTGKTYKNLTYIVSRITAQTKKGQKWRKENKVAWRKYDDRVDQKEDWKKTRGKIKDKKIRDKYDRAYKKVIEQSRGRQHELESVYDEETDEFYFETQ